MKVSEITEEKVADYLRLDYENMTEAEKSELAAIISAAKNYLKSFTGHVDETVSGEELTEFDYNVYQTKYKPIVPNTLVVRVDGNEVNFIADYAEGLITFDETPVTTPVADYKAGIDAFEEFVIAVYVLCQDMYDNRSMYVDNANVNKVVENILSMHSINLL